MYQILAIVVSTSHRDWAGAQLRGAGGGLSPPPPEVLGGVLQFVQIRRLFIGGGRLGGGVVPAKRLNSLVGYTTA